MQYQPVPGAPQTRPDLHVGTGPLPQTRPQAHQPGATYQHNPGGYTEDRTQDDYLQGAATKKDQSHLQIWCLTAFLSFVVAFCAIFATGIGKPVDFFQITCLALWSLVLMIQSIPMKPNEESLRNGGRAGWIFEVKDDIEKYVHFLTRWTFKGLFFIFLGASEISFYWVGIHTGISWAGSVIGFVIVVVGCMTTMKGIHMSNKLASLRDKVRHDPHFPESEVRQGELWLPTDFSRFAQDQRQIRFDVSELKQIFLALCCERPLELRFSKLTNQDLKDWKDGWKAIL